MARTTLSLDRVRVERRELAPQAKLHIWLPMPPSTNNLYANTPGGGRYATQAYRQWRAEAEAMLKRQRPGRILGPVQIALVFEEPKRARDGDNFLKAIFDCLVAGHIIDGDTNKTIRRCSFEFADVEGVVAEISRYRPIIAEKDSQEAP